MNTIHSDPAGVINTSQLYLKWAYIPWDSQLYDTPVLQITHIELRGEDAKADIQNFLSERDKMQATLVSCRLSCDQLRESMFLEDQGFRFIEMLYQPELSNLEQAALNIEDTEIVIEHATPKDLSALEDIAGHAFRNERFHIDPRLDPAFGDQRYRNWVRNSFNHECQKLYAIKTGAYTLAFFITEMMMEGTCYWHLNAVSPNAQGKGYGKQIWRLMIAEARREGATRIRTSIVARNYRVLNLYAQLGFRFSKPLMTFHWVRVS